MKIKIPFTEKALLDFYNFLEQMIEGVGEIIPSPLIKLPRFNYHLYARDYNKLSKFFNRKYRRQKIYRFIDLLRKAGYLKTKNLDKYRIINWTNKGIEKIFLSAMKTMNNKRKLDKKYLMVVFDIPESKRKKRDRFRMMLKLLGYKQFQKSIWISAFDVFRETQNLIKIFDLEPFVQFFVLEKIALNIKKY